MVNDERIGRRHFSTISPTDRSCSGGDDSEEDHSVDVGMVMDLSGDPLVLGGTLQVHDASVAAQPRGSHQVLLRSFCRVLKETILVIVREGLVS